MKPTLLILGLLLIAGMASAVVITRLNDGRNIVKSCDDVCAGNVNGSCWWVKDNNCDKPTPHTLQHPQMCNDLVQHFYANGSPNNEASKVPCMVNQSYTFNQTVEELNFTTNWTTTPINTTGFFAISSPAPRIYPRWIAAKNSTGLWNIYSINDGVIDGDNPISERAATHDFYCPHNPKTSVCLVGECPQQYLSKGKILTDSPKIAGDLCEA